ncbi:MAG: SGNH/GDSL hydrolase family protein [Ginsengibacter sp.]
MKKYLSLISFLILYKSSFCQQKLNWHQPKFVEGVCVMDTSNIFHRIPLEMKNRVREGVWYLSTNTAGEFIHFKTSAKQITVKYALDSKDFSFPHMPATGVSGVDLFALDAHGKWNWAAGKYHFGDTCQYVYNHLAPETNNSDVSDFYLYLPLYNTVNWISIGVDENAKFLFAEKSRKKPIVAYGTSILQGGVTSRPGLAWTNILGRNIDRTIINLGFSGEGKLEAPIFDLMSIVDADMYILDCMPNLTDASYEEVKSRVMYGVKKLREKNKAVPILFAEHADAFIPFYMDTAEININDKSSKLIARVFNELKLSGTKNIFMLTDKEIDFDINSTVDGSHPNDIGMMKYALAYEKMIRKILNDLK